MSLFYLPEAFNSCIISIKMTMKSTHDEQKQNQFLHFRIMECIRYNNDIPQRSV